MNIDLSIKKPIVYIDKSHFDFSFNQYVFEILKANFFNDLTIEERQTKHFDLVNIYTFTDKIEEADFAMLPMAWNYYIENNKVNLAQEFINYCKSKNKKIATYIAYDYGVTPTVKDIYIFRQSGYASKRLIHQYSCPFFLNDQLKRRYKTESIFIREKMESPLVGFCGQANISFAHNMWHLFNIMINNFKYYTHLKRWEPQTLYPPVLRREKVIDILEKSNLIKTNFIKRKAYRGGANNAETKEKTTKEYYENLINSDYILCIRGGGNFSVRLFETMMVGRIPLFINTDCILPFDNIIDWKKHVVWVEEKDMRFAPQILNDFHNEIHPDDFIQLQLDNRNIWVNHLSNKGIFENIARTLMN